MLYITMGDIKEGRHKEHQNWIAENKAKIQKHAPSGWKYKGAYETVLGFGRHDFIEVWEIKNYGDFDNLRNHKDREFDRLMGEESEFKITGSGESMLVREMADVVIAEPAKKRKK